MHTRSGFCYSRPESIIYSRTKRSRLHPIDHPATIKRRRREGIDYFDSLPDELLISILCNVSSAATSPADLANIRITCKRMNKLGQHRVVLFNASARSLAVRARKWSNSARSFLNRCAEAGNLAACYAFGMIQFYCFKNRASGLSMIGKAAMGSHAAALYSLAIIKFNRSGGSKSENHLSDGVALCRRAATLGHVGALRELGHCLQHGYGVDQKFDKGRQLIIEARTRELAGAGDNDGVNRFLAEWFQARGGPGEKGLRVCSHLGCGRVETRRREFRRCFMCGIVNYCSSRCENLQWKLAHKFSCVPVDH